jgi:DNA recombination protein RmuC
MPLMALPHGHEMLLGGLLALLLFSAWVWLFVAWRRLHRAFAVQQTALTEAQMTQARLEERLLEVRSRDEHSQRQWQERLAEGLAREEQARSSLQQLQQAYATEIRTRTALETQLAANEKRLGEQQAVLQEARTQLGREFENLAHKIFDEKNRQLNQQQQSHMTLLLSPFREQIEHFQKRVNDVHDTSLRNQRDLVAEIQKVCDIGLKMRDEADNLTQALKGDSQVRGAWGEAQLERTLEASGLIQPTHFSKQMRFKDAAGHAKQTDFVVHLPDGKHLIIDSKVSLLAYSRWVAADDDSAREREMVAHLQAVKRHIDDLASKDYTQVIGVHSPSFVLLFMPIESAYHQALRSEKDLFHYGYERGVVLVSHTTLAPLLKTVANIWMLDRSQREARELSEKAGDLYNQVCLVAERLQKLGAGLSSVSNHYNSTVTALAGQQGLYGKVERFSQLSAKITKTLPVLEAEHRDIDLEKLTPLVEQVTLTALPVETPS